MNRRNHKTGTILLSILTVLWVGWVLQGGLRPLSAEAAEDTSRDTMLMFVGMDLEVLSIASRREESASQAPAIARVINRDQIQNSGYTTLAEILSMTPGFYLAPKEWGSQPYLRGLQNSALFLYDTVPMHSSINKTVHPLDHELSLASIKRVEIIRGPGSVLWGPDAYGGIINVVPLTGSDIDGADTGVLYNSAGDQVGGYLNVGHDAGFWDAFFSVSGRYGEEDERRYNIVEFWRPDDKPAPPEERFGRGSPDDAHYLDVSGRFAWGEMFNVTGRFSDFEKSYTVSAEDAGIWSESRSTPFNFLKAEGKTDLDGNSAARFMGYYSTVRSDYEVIDKSYSPSEYTYYGEMIYDRRFRAGQGLFTGGLSYRQRQVDGAPVWDSYLPEYLGTDNLSFLPSIREVDYENTLWSVFGQYSHKLGKVDLFFGGRYDNHDAYADNFSFNTGIVWPFLQDWRLKLLYGTAYRTPFAKQLIDDYKPNLEEIDTFNAQLSWSPSKQATLSACGFISRISDHIMQDPYAGLSEPNHQSVNGVEVAAEISPVDTLTFSANMTFVNNSGPDETYHYLAFSYIRPDGTVEEVYEDISYPFDIGPDVFGNIMLEWLATKKLTLFGRLSYAAGHKLVFPRGDDTADGDDLWRVDLNALYRNIAGSHTDLNVSVRNLFDQEDRLPGTYEIIETAPVSVEVVLRKHW